MVAVVAAAVGVAAAAVAAAAVVLTSTHRRNLLIVGGLRTGSNTPLRTNTKITKNSPRERAHKLKIFTGQFYAQ